MRHHVQQGDARINSVNIWSEFYHYYKLIQAVIIVESLRRICYVQFVRLILAFSELSEFICDVSVLNIDLEPSCSLKKLTVYYD